MTRTWTYRFAATASVVALSLVGCASNPTNSGGSTSTPDGKVHLIWDMWAGGADDEKWLEDTANIARTKFPEISLEVRTSSWEDYFTKLTASASSGTMSCLTSMNGQRLSAFYTALSPLSSEDLKAAGINESDFAEGALEILSYDGKLYGVPYDVAAMLMFYNKDLLAQAGVAEPTANWTFDDFMKTVRAATTDTHKGFGVGLSEYQWLALPIAKSGLQPVNEEGRLDLTNPKFVEAADWYSDLVKVEKVASLPPSASEAWWGEEQYAAGNIAMTVGGTWSAAKFFQNQSGFTAGATRLPIGAPGPMGFILGSGFGISATCEGAEREAALKVLGALVSKEAQDLMASIGRSYPAVKASQPLYFESLPEEIRSDVQRAFEEGFKGVEGQRTISTWPQINEYLTPNLLEVYTGRMTMQQLMETTQRQFGN